MKCLFCHRSIFHTAAVTVYEKPTETFYDVAASGGIAVGDYIDYAWSGYNETPAIWELLDP